MLHQAGEVLAFSGPVRLCAQTWKSPPGHGWILKELLNTRSWISTIGNAALSLLPDLLLVLLDVLHI